MKIVQLIAQHATFLIVLFVVGCTVSLVRAFRKNLSTNQSKLLKLLEWCLLPPGFAGVFVTLQQQSVRYFALYPGWTITAFLGVVAFSVLLMVEKKKERHAFRAWLGGLVGVPGVVFSFVLLGLYFQSPRKFEQVRATYIDVANTVGKTAPNFVFTLLSNREERQLADYRGRTVLLNIWATWCVPCLKEMPDLDRLQKKLGGERLVVINLSDESFEVVERYLSKHPMVTTHGLVEKKDVPEFYQFGTARPTSFVIGANGEVIESIVGARDLKYFESVIPIR
jgi:thiol-disulfide isomerase/thioredoxin